MAKTIVERSLGNNDPYALNYIRDTIGLSKSFVIHTPEEAETYNAYLYFKRGMKINGYDKTTWRYYKHLTGQYHEADEPMKVISRDNRKEFVLTVESIELNLETKRELALYGSLYETLIIKYPQQELLLKSIINNSTIPTMKEVLEYKKWQIVSFCDKYVEYNETNLIEELQERIYQFSVSKLITSYRVIDNLFMPGLMATLTCFIYRNLQTIRLANCRTGKVHSYHILNYFASHHGLDTIYDQLDAKQRLYLYRNMNYLNAHAGTDKVFDEIIDKFFTYRDIVVTNLIYNKGNEVRDDSNIDYHYVEELLNDKPFVHDEKPKTQEELELIEKDIYENNEKEYVFNRDEIDETMVGSDSSEVITKDLIINTNDNTNEVKYKLFDVLCDYWAVTVELGYNTVHTTIEDPSTNKTMELSAHDAFKLFITCLHFSHGLRIENIPDYHVWNVFKNELPETEDLFKILQRRIPLVEREITVIHSRVPGYRHMDTARLFREFVESIYNFELGMWIYLSSTGELYSRYDIGAAFEKMHTPMICSNNNESVKDFFDRIDFGDVYDFTDNQLEELMATIISSITNNIMEHNEIIRNVQEAAITIFEKFKSYSTQILSNVNVSDTILAGLVMPYYSLAETKSSDVFRITLPKELLCHHIEVGNKYELVEEEQVETHINTEWLYEINMDENISISSDSKINLGFVEMGVCVTLNRELSTPRDTPTEDMIKDFLI